MDHDLLSQITSLLNDLGGLADYLKDNITPLIEKLDMSIGVNTPNNTPPADTPGPG